jgi:hypothetical protein
MEHETIKETREQLMQAILFHLSFLSYDQLRIVRGFVRGLRRP